MLDIAGSFLEIRCSVQSKSCRVMGDNRPMPSSNESYCIFVWQVSELQGIILTHLESLGLPSGQEKAAKSILKTQLWDWLYRSGNHVIELGEGFLIHEDELKAPKTSEELRSAIEILLKGLKK